MSTAGLNGDDAARKGLGQNAIIKTGVSLALLATSGMEPFQDGEDGCFQGRERPRATTTGIREARNKEMGVGSSSEPLSTLKSDIKGSEDIKTNGRISGPGARVRNRLQYPSQFHFRKTVACSLTPCTFHNPNFTGATASPGCGSPVRTVLGGGVLREG